MRECLDIPASNFYGVFREWLDQNYPVLDSDVFGVVMEEDRSIDYSVTGSGVVQNEGEIEVENSVDISSDDTFLLV